MYREKEEFSKLEIPHFTVSRSAHSLGLKPFLLQFYRDLRCFQFTLESNRNTTILWTDGTVEECKWITQPELVF